MIIGVIIIFQHKNINPFSFPQSSERVAPERGLLKQIIMKTVSQIFSKQELVDMLVNAQNIRMPDLDEMLRDEYLVKGVKEFTHEFKCAVGLELSYLGSNQYRIIYNNFDI